MSNLQGFILETARTESMKSSKKKEKKMAGLSDGYFRHPLCQPKVSIKNSHYDLNFILVCKFISKSGNTLKFAQASRKKCQITGFGRKGFEMAIYGQSQKLHTQFTERGKMRHT